MARSASFEIDPKVIERELEKELFKAIAEVAAKSGQSVYCIGGHVRDLILNRPSKDVDIVVEGDGISIAEAVSAELGAGKVTVFKRFGTAMFMHNDVQVELVGARKESYTEHSRKPDVEPGTLEDDQNRRDFTMNTLAFSLNKLDQGDLIDPFDGLDDLLEGTIRTPLDPDITYSDDPLRMMRAIRFASQLGFTIEERSFKAISENAERIKIVSMERVTEELNKIILSPKPSVGLGLMFKSGLMKLVLPEMHALQGIEIRNGVAHKDNFWHTLQVLDNVS